MQSFTLSLPVCIGLLCVFLATQHVNGSFPYYGTKIGALKQLHHGVSGDVYAVDSRTIFIRKFNYDGGAPAAYFYVGNTDKPSNEGAIRLRDERGGNAALQRRYRNKDITLSLPDGKTLRDFKWFSIWCDEFAVNFGDVSVPANLDFPRPQKITGLKGVHEVTSDNIVIVDAQTLLVPNFSYDGEAPDAKFWVGRGQRPTAQGVRIPDENGTENPLRRYEKKTIVLTLPGDLTIFDIGHFGIWCEAFTVDFGHVRIPEGLNVPPSLKMLGISPQSKLNCEVLYDDLAFEVRWAVAGESIVVQLVAKLAENEYMSFGISPSKDRSVMIGSDVVVAWVDRATGKGYAQDYYLDDKSQCSGSRGTCPDVNIEDNTNSIRLLNAAMVNGYSIVTYQRSLQATDRLDLPISVNGTEAIVWAIGPLNERREASFHSQYTKQTHYIEFGRQPTWNCPMPENSQDSNSSYDSNEAIDGDDDVENASVSSSTSGGYPPARSPTLGNIPEEEEEFYDNRPQALQQTNRRQYPTSSPNKSNALQVTDKPVPTPKPANTNGAWDIPPIQCYEPEDGVFYAQMGPTGGKHGYPAITGHVGWGISWYINGLLIPEIHVVRGKTYTFVVEGGNNPDIPAKYHPFYITDDPVGGYEHKREEEKKAIRIFAGVHRSRSGQVTPIGVGRLCNWTPDIDGPPADDYQSFGAYQRTLTLKCDQGEPGVITWKPDANTPDTVYYHCYTHRYLGWKIHVHDTCEGARYAAAASASDTVAAASGKHEIRIAAPVLPIGATATDDYNVEDITAEQSIRHETKVSPNANFLLKHQTDLIKNHNMNGTPPKLSFEITKSTEITKLISDGIRAAEALEQSILRQTNTNSNSNKNNNSNSNNINPNSNSSNHKQQQNHQANPKPNQNQNAYNNNQNKKATSSASSTSSGSSSSTGKQPSYLQGEKHIAHIQQQQQQIQSHASIHTHNHYLQQQKSQQHNSSPLAHVHYAHYQQHLKNPNYYHHIHPLNTQLQSQSQSHNASQSNQSNHNVPAQLHKTIGLSEYLRPPQNAPLFHPVKLPGRRPPPPAPASIKKLHSNKPIILPQQLPKRQHTVMAHGAEPPSSASVSVSAASIPQPSMIVNHYRKPVPGLLRPFVKEKPFPIQRLAVLLLGQSTELVDGGIGHDDHQQHKTDAATIGHVKVPYGDLLPQQSVQNNNNLAPVSGSVYAPASNSVLSYPNSKRDKKPKPPPIIHDHYPPRHQHQHLVDAQKQNPSKIHIDTASLNALTNSFAMVQEEPSSSEIATMQPAINKGFKPDTVVVESGFRPITRRDNAIGGDGGPGSGSGSGSDSTISSDDDIEPIANRREDPGTEIDEVMETDTLFLSAQKSKTQTQHFEPMFIPSPPDSTNATIVTQQNANIQLPLALQRHKQIDENEESLGSPIATKLRDLTRTNFNVANGDDANDNDNHKDDRVPDLDLIVPTSLSDGIESETNMADESITTIRTERDNNAKVSSNLSIHQPQHQHQHHDHHHHQRQQHQPQLQQQNTKTLGSGQRRKDDEKADDLVRWEDTLHPDSDFEELMFEDEWSDDINNDKYEMDEDEEEYDREAQAAERIDTYYLPPDNRKIPDANLPSGAVVTYDGKSVIDSSLVLPPKLDSSDVEGGGGNVRRLSKIEELIRTTPQFVPFRGEIPPVISDFLSTERSKSSPEAAAAAAATAAAAALNNSTAPHTISTLTLSPPLPPQAHSIYTNSHVDRSTYNTPSSLSSSSSSLSSPSSSALSSSSLSSSSAIQKSTNSAAVLSAQRQKTTKLHLSNSAA